MTNKPTVLVIGCGAIGGLYAAHLTRVADVIGFDANRAHADAINRGGLKVTGRSEFLARFPAFADPALLPAGPVDAVLVLVKSRSTAAAFKAVRPRLSGRPLVATLQNGMGNVELLQALCEWDIAHGVSTEAARYLAPGAIEHLIRGEDTWLGPARGPVESVAWLGRSMNEAGIPTRVAADPRGAIWSKFIFNCVMNPIGAIVLGENRARYEVPEVAALIDAMFAECARVAEAQGISLQFDPMQMVKKTRAGELPLTTHAGSMATDIAAGRETELEAMTGYLVRQARTLGVPVPVTETVYRLAKGVEYAARARRSG